jgi:excisionase family DNA binding protein
MQEVLSFEEACQILKIAKPTLYNYVRKGQIPAFKLGRSWKFHKDSLEHWMRDRVQEQTQERKSRAPQ